MQPRQNFLIIDEFESRRKRRIIVYGSVARYGPRIQLPAQGGWKLDGVSGSHAAMSRQWSLFSELVAGDVRDAGMTVARRGGPCKRTTSVAVAAAFRLAPSRYHPPNVDPPVTLVHCVVRLDRENRALSGLSQQQQPPPRQLSRSRHFQGHVRHDEHSIAKFAQSILCVCMCMRACVCVCVCMRVWEKKSARVERSANARRTSVRASMNRSKFRNGRSWSSTRFEGKTHDDQTRSCSYPASATPYT